MQKYKLLQYQHHWFATHAWESVSLCFQMQLLSRKILKKILLAAILVPVVLLVLLQLNYSLITAIGGKHIYTDVNEIPYRKNTLVPGSGSSPEGLWQNLTFENRMKAVVSLYRNHKTSRIIASGISNRLYYNEPNDMKASLLAAGLPSIAVYPDHGGINTWASVERSVSYYGCNEIIIVSQSEQLERALFIAWLMGYDAIGFEADPVHHQHRYWTVREYLARAKCIFDFIAYSFRNL